VRSILKTRAESILDDYLIENLPWVKRYSWNKIHPISLKTDLDYYLLLMAYTISWSRLPAYAVHRWYLGTYTICYSMLYKCYCSLLERGGSYGKWCHHWRQLEKAIQTIHTGIIKFRVRDVLGKRNDEIAALSQHLLTWRRIVTKFRLSVISLQIIITWQELHNAYDWH